MNQHKENTRPGFNVRPFLFKMASWLMPVRIVKTRSSVNPYLEVVLYNGQLMLNGRHANYSYGNLLKAFREVFDSQHMADFQPRNAVTLGMGAGCVPQELKKRYPGIRQTAVELDPAVTELYKNHFPAVQDLTVVQGNALEFMAGSEASFDLIIVDVYEELVVPSEFHQPPFVHHLSTHLNPGGLVIFNQVVRSSDQGLIQELLTTFSGQFKQVNLFRGSYINHFLIARNEAD